MPTLKGMNYMVALIFTFSTFNNLSAQTIETTGPIKPHLYVSAAYVSSNPMNESTTDPFYSAGNGPSADKTVRVDLGLQFNDNLSFELGYIRTPLRLTDKLEINNRTISEGSSSFTRINFFSLL